MFVIIYKDGSKNLRITLENLREPYNKERNENERRTRFRV